MIVAKDARIQGFLSTHKLKEQEICIITENPGIIKRQKILMDIEEYNNLKKELVG